MKTKIIDRCRVCGSKKLIPILSLGSLYVSNFVEGDVDKNDKPVQLELVLCELSGGGCGLLQLRHTVSPKKMYRNYWYLSGTSTTMVEALANITSAAEKIIKFAAGDIAVDIGSNDGTLLRSYKTEGLKKIGFEPSVNLAHLGEKGGAKIFNNFFNAMDFKNEYGEERAKAITAVAMFYDIDDPNSFVRDIQEILHPEGLFIIQMAYLPTMLAQNAFDNICHEHLEYYSLSSLIPLLSRHGLEVFDVELNDVNGGSFRTYIRNKGSTIGKEGKAAEKRVADLLAREKKLGLDNKKIYEEFAQRVLGLKKKLREFIKSETAAGRKIYVYGASTKGNTLLQFFELNPSFLPKACDKNSAKWGTKTIGTNIPIVSKEEARRDKPDYFLILPWHFLKEMVEEERKYLSSGGKFIVPLPEFRIVGKEVLL